jgi:hypothetical protein
LMNESSIGQEYLPWHYPNSIVSIPHVKDLIVG